MVGQLGHEGVADIRQNQSQQLGAAHDHGPGNGIDRVIHFLADLQDAVPGVLTDFGTSGKRPGHRGVGDTGYLCNIFDGNVFHSRPSLRKYPYIYLRILYRVFPKKSTIYAKNSKNFLSAGRKMFHNA